MNRFPFTAMIALALLLSGAAPAHALDTAAETRWAADLRAQVTTGEPVTLNAGPKAGIKSVFALYTPAEGNPKGAVILLPDLDRHPDWPGVIGPLRRRLPHDGWATLAVQMPVPDPGEGPAKYGALLDAAMPRIHAAVAYLQGKGAKYIVLLGHGLGAVEATAYLADPAHHGPEGLITIGMGSWKGLDPRLDTVKLWPKLKAMPTYDIHGGQDSAAVRHAATARRAALPSGGPRVRGTPPTTVDITPFRPGSVVHRYATLFGAGHDFSDFGRQLEQRVAGWLKGLPQRIRKARSPALPKEKSSP